MKLGFLFLLLNSKFHRNFTSESQLKLQLLCSYHKSIQFCQSLKLIDYQFQCLTFDQNFIYFLLLLYALFFEIIYLILVLNFTVHDFSKLKLFEPQHIRLIHQVVHLIHHFLPHLRHIRHLTVTKSLCVLI